MKDNSVILGITKSIRFIFDEEFPLLPKVDIPSYGITYSRYVPLSLKLFLDAPRILKVVRQEHRQLQQIVKDHHIDVVISDNRLGLYHAHVETVYITHQLNIQAGLCSSVANYIHHFYIKKFSKIAVPDYEQVNQALAGKLSRHQHFSACTYLGPLSRLNTELVKTGSYDYLILLSGVEPQRSMLEKALCEKIRSSSKRIAFVRGTRVPLDQALPGNVEVIDLPDASQMAQYIRNADTVICRSGYSTLMDLHCLGKQKIVLVPTPGQGEQLYLAHYWKKKYGAQVIFQQDIERLIL